MSIPFQAVLRDNEADFIKTEYNKNETSFTYFTLPVRDCCRRTDYRMHR